MEDYWVRKRILDQGENPALMGSNGGKAAARNRARKEAKKPWYAKTKHSAETIERCQNIYD